MEFLDSLHQVKTNWEPYKKWEKEQDNKEAQRQELNKRIKTSNKDLEKADQYGHTVVDAINIMDQYSINKAEDVENVTKPLLQNFPLVGVLAGFGVGSLIHASPIGKKLINGVSKDKASKITCLIFGIPAALGFLGSIILGNIQVKTYEKESSRIARYQAREVELKDPRNFVIYNKKQIEEAQKIAETLPDIPDKNKAKETLNPIKLYSQSIKSIRELSKDHKNYKKWKQGFLKEEDSKKKSFDGMKVPPEELKKAKRDRDNILNIVKKIEIYSQNYLTNAETAMNAIFACDLIAGTLGGGIISGGIWLLQKTKLLSKNSNIANRIKSFSPIIAPAVLLSILSPYTIKIQKSAAKIGRFKAKQELLKDPHNFIAYDDDQKASVKDIEAPPKTVKGFWGKLKDDITTFIHLKKDYEEYEEYNKNEGKKEVKLREALKKVDIAPEQIKEAKALQKNAFHTFEKMDEMTQRYSDDVEGAAGIIESLSAITTAYVGAGLSMFLMSRNKELKDPNAKLKSEKLILDLLPMIMASLVNVPIAIKAVQVRRQAGRIGIMKAMQDLDDPRNFVNTDNQKQPI